MNENLDGNNRPIFGHKQHADPPAPAPRAPSPPPAAPDSVSGHSFGYHSKTALNTEAAAAVEARSEITDLRTLCMTKIDAATVATLPPDRLLVEVERLISELASENHVQMNGREQHQLASEIVDDMVGLGPLEPLLLDDTINDILVNGPDHVFVERKGMIEQVPVRFQNWEHLTNICQRIAASIGRHVDESSPMVDARLADGSRVNVVLPPLTLDGPAIAIRKFSKKNMDFDALVKAGSMPREVAKILEICARCRLNIIISGGTGSGKTTLMNAMSRYIDPKERIITVEDVAELQLQQPDLVRMETRPLNLEGKGEITTRDLVRNALRMRPDRIIVGEVRGEEAFDMLQAMNTGHAGSLSTIHANSTRDALARIENMVQMSNMGLPAKSIRTELAAAVHMIVQLDRQRDGVRRITEVTEINGIEGDMILLNDIFKWKVTGETPDGKLVGHYEVRRTRPRFFDQLRYFNLDRTWNDVLAQTVNEPEVFSEPE